MKTILLFSLLLFSIELQAQTKFRTGQYNPKEYKFDRNDAYRPGVATIFALVPGAGHAYLGEPLRALGVVGMMGGSVVAMVIGEKLMASDYTDNQENGAGLFLGGAALFVASYFHSILDARSVAKQKNMYLREMNLSMDWYPSVQRFNACGAQNGTIMGLTLAFQF